ncbi:hypothetical protein PHYC_03703 [Phycisphaerales bacterium]|nr:hypothetical protein PHYC_03703 [Phycisphaerales bacterium]
MNRARPIVLISLGLANACVAQPVPDYGLEWRTIGSLGNAPASPDDFVFLGPDFGGPGPIGRVDHEYRLARTELTVAQYLEFVQAYSVLRPSAAFEPGFYGSNIYRTSDDPANFGWQFIPDSEFAPADMSWLYAARYCNWLTNSKANELWAFESGAYDTSTFVRGPDGIWSGQGTHSVGALFWVPSLDEWTKGFHYDPDKLAPGEGGYWLYPHGSDTAPVGGFPWTPGAETAAGNYPGGEGFRIFPVGSYPTTQSPWGLLDGSGGESEWLEWDAPTAWLVRTRGSESNLRHPQLADRLDNTGGDWPDIAGNGLRLASIAPAPGTAFLAFYVIGWVGTRKDRLK